MEIDHILNKFGDEYIVNEDTYRLGIDIRITDHLAKRFQNKFVLETCTGGGFTTISLAKYAKHVYTFEIDNKRMNEAIENCKIAGVEKNVTFYNKDIYTIMNMGIRKRIEAAFLDPDWDNLRDNYIFRFKKSMTKPPSDELLMMIMKITNNITIVQPPYIRKDEFNDLDSYEFEEIILNNEKALYCLHFGTLKRVIGNSEYRI